MTCLLQIKNVFRFQHSRATFEYFPYDAECGHSRRLYSGCVPWLRHYSVYFRIHTGHFWYLVFDSTKHTAISPSKGTIPSEKTKSNVELTSSRFVFYYLIKISESRRFAEILQGIHGKQYWWAHCIQRRISSPEIHCKWTESRRKDTFEAYL